VADSVRRRLRGPAGLWLSVFGVSLGLFAIRLLVPVPVGQADNRDGPRLMCGLGFSPVTHGFPRFFRYAYFEYVHTAGCAGNKPYPTSEVVPVELARLLTPVFGLPGAVNLIALGLLMCGLASAGIASLVTGLRIRLWARLLVAAAVWLIMADAAFFDVFASPFSEPAALVGLLLVAAGVVYLGRDQRSTMLGLVLAGSGGFLAILAKEQYVVLAVPICLTLILASGDRGRGRGLRRYRTRQTAAAAVVAAVLAVMSAAYITWDYTSHYGRRLHMIQAVDMIFQDIVTRHDRNKAADLRALGMPASWSRYAGTYYWDPRRSVRFSHLLPRYSPKFNGLNIVHFLLTHPGRAVSIGQVAAIQAQRFRVTQLGDYAQSAGYPRGAVESRVVVLTWLMHQLPPRLGFWLFVPLWLGMTALALAALRWGRARAWHRDGAVLILCLTGCAVAAFIPPAYFAGISTTRHMVGSNISTAFAVTVGVALAVSLIWPVLTRSRRRTAPTAAPARPEMARPS
jgi:hypothetical protein